MNKILKRIRKFIKKLVKDFLNVCDIVTKKISTYKKTIIGICLVIFITLLIILGKGMIFSTLAKTVVVSESEILRRVGTHTALPNQLPTSIVRVKDAESLRTQQDFYKYIKEGDYIIIYPDRAIIYDLRADVIVGEKSLQQ